MSDPAVEETAPLPTYTADREERLLQAFVELNGGLVNDLDIHELLHRLAEHCLDLLAASACGILLTDGAEPLALVAAVPHEHRILEVFQLESHEGPCLECFRTGQPVRSADLVADARRWPMWVNTALRHGFRTVYATPLRTDQRVIGTLNMFGRDPIGIATPDLLLIRALADVATVSILQRRTADNAEAVQSQLQLALISRVQIEQAKGIVSHALGISMDAAFHALRHTSRSTSTKLIAISAGIIDATIRPVDLLRPGLSKGASPS